MTNKAVKSLQGQDCVLVGAGGHAKVVHELAELCGATILGVCDPKFQGGNDHYWDGLKILGGDDYLANADPEAVLLLNGIGMLPGNRIRRVVYERFVSQGYRFPPLIHPLAWVSPNGHLGDGVQVMAGAVVQPGASIGSNTIINTHGSVDHDSTIGAHCHLAPGATLCGDVTLGDGTFVGAGATIVQAVTVAADKFIKAGSLIARDVL